MTTLVLFALLYAVTKFFSVLCWFANVIANFFNLKPSNVLCWFVKMISTVLEYVVMFVLDLVTISVIFVTSCFLAHISWFVKMISIALEYVVMFLLDLATISVIFVTSCILAHIINVYDLSEVCFVCWRFIW